MLRIQETRPALRRYQSSQTECPLRNQEMNSSGLCGSVVAVVGTAAVGCGDRVAAERLCRAAALASLKQPMHAVVLFGEMAANACCKPVPRLAIGSSPTAPQTHLSDMVRFYKLYVKTGQGTVINRKVRYPMVEEPKVKSSKPTPCILIGTHGNMTTCIASP